MTVNKNYENPFWSVMIPTYSPDEQYLRITLESVLLQDPGSENMQIEVVDDCSPNCDVSEIVKSIAGNRVTVSKTNHNSGLAGCWNTCITRSRGQWIHLLHQDDVVLDGFYKRFESLIINSPNLDAAFCRYVHADSDGNWTLLSPLYQKHTGEFIDFNSVASIGTPIQCVAAVVKKETYNRVGIYDINIPYALDWEMWCRIGAVGKWGYVTQVGGVYREHDHSESTRLRNTRVAYLDIVQSGIKARAHLPLDVREKTSQSFNNSIVKYIYGDALLLYVKGRLVDVSYLLFKFIGYAIKSNYFKAWFWLLIRVEIKRLFNIVYISKKK
jgi:glycosyltransferase involved in cell wall biosynthesis